MVWAEFVTTLIISDYHIKVSHTYRGRYVERGWGTILTIEKIDTALDAIKLGNYYGSITSKSHIRIYIICTPMTMISWYS